MNLNFSTDVTTAVDCFRPLIKKLNIREETINKYPTCLVEIPELDFLGPLNWTLAIEKEHSGGSSCGRLITRYRKKFDCMQSIIYLDQTLFFETEPAKKKRKIVAIHEFCHFAASIYPQLIMARNNPGKRG